jgi:hypothetical protein
MGAVRGMAACRLRAGFLMFAVLVSVAVAGCGSVGRSRVVADAAVVHSRVTPAARAVSQSPGLSGRASGVVRSVVASRTAVIARREAVIARRNAASARSARRAFAKITKRPARVDVRPLSPARARAAEVAAKARERAAVAKSKRISALAVRADPTGCLKSSGALAASRTPARLRTRAQALAVRRLVLGCLSASRAAGRQMQSLARSGGSGR